MIHKPSQETKDYIASWADVPIPFSKNDEWHRYGFIGAIGYEVLNGKDEWNIVEIGCGESSIYLTQLARKFSRKIYICDIEHGKLINPMTVPGYLHEDSIFVTTGKPISYEHKGIHYGGSSDDFFKEVKFEKIGLAYIDGGHTYEQAKRDFDNIFKILEPNGVIILHDTYPPSEEFLSPDTACGDVYKLRKELEKRNDLDCFTFVFPTACGVGLTITRKHSTDGKYYHD
jgi:hypothetical protein